MGGDILDESLQIRGRGSDGGREAGNGIIGEKGSEEDRGNGGRRQTGIQPNNNKSDVINASN